MSKVLKITSLLLCLSLLVSIFSFSISTVAVEDGTQGYIVGEGVNMREEAIPLLNLVELMLLFMRLLQVKR